MASRMMRREDFGANVPAPAIRLGAIHQHLSFSLRHSRAVGDLLRDRTRASP